MVLLTAFNTSNGTMRSRIRTSLPLALTLLENSLPGNPIQLCGHTLYMCVCPETRHNSCRQHITSPTLACVFLNCLCSSAGAAYGWSTICATDTHRFEWSQVNVFVFMWMCACVCVHIWNQGFNLICKSKCFCVHICAVPVRQGAHWPGASLNTPLPSDSRFHLKWPSSAPRGDNDLFTTEGVKGRERGEGWGGAARRKDRSDWEGGEKSGCCCRNREGWKEMGWQGCVVCGWFFFFFGCFFEGCSSWTSPCFSAAHALPS